MTAMAALENVRIEMSDSNAVLDQLTEEATIGEMAAEFGVSLRTLRFYEDRHLLRPRREGNARLYGPTERLRLQMILKGKQLGFTLTEISELIGAQDADDDFEGKLQPAQIVTQIDHLERQRLEIEEAITRLRATHARLAGISGSPERQLSA